MVINLAPVVIFTYRRKKKLENLIKSILKNKEAKNTTVYFFQDSYKNQEDQNDVNEVKKYIKKVKGFKKKIIILRKKKLGLAKNIISGINLIFKNNKKAIFLEDDLIVSSNYIKFMNQALDKYYKNKKVWHINGWSYQLKNNLNQDVFFSKNMNCWGWGTWRNRWQKYDNDSKKLIKKFNVKMINEFNFNSQLDNWSQIIRNHKKKISTWAIFWYAIIFINNGLCLSFSQSLARYDGFDLRSTHSHSKSPYNNIYKNSLSKKKIINFPSVINEDKNYINKLSSFIKEKQNFFFRLKNILSKLLKQVN